MKDNTKKPHTFNVGDGATFNLFTDRHAGTVIKATAKTVTFQRDKVTLDKEKSDLNFSVGGFAAHVSGKQVWKTERDPEGYTQVFSLRSNGRWVKKGAKMNSRGYTLSPGRHEKYDYNF